MNQRLAAVFAAVTTTAALTTLGTATSAAADSTVLNYPAEYLGTPKAGTAGLILRDRDGNPTGSGMYEGTRFKFLGTCATANGVRLVRVLQVESGGWGPSYKGWVKRKFANLPPNLPC